MRKVVGFWKSSRGDYRNISGHSLGPRVHLLPFMKRDGGILRLLAPNRSRRKLWDKPNNGNNFARINQFKNRCKWSEAGKAKG